MRSARWPRSRSSLAQSILGGGKWPESVDRPLPDRPRKLLRRVGTVDPESIESYRRTRRLFRAGASRGARSRRRHPRGDRSQAARPRRRGLSDRAQVGLRCQSAGSPALPRVQRGRVGARHLQRSRADGARPIRGGRSDDHRRFRHRLRAGLPVCPGGISARETPHRKRHPACPLEWFPRRGYRG